MYKNYSNFTNLLLKVDSYKHSHFLQQPPHATKAMAYIESRGGVYAKTLVFGPQAILKEHFSTPLTHADIDEAMEVLEAHGVPFNESGWRRIVNVFHGNLPLKIRSVREGTWVPTHNALLTVESTDDESVWLVSFIESLMLRMWYTTTVATISGYIMRALVKNAHVTSDLPDDALRFKLHDFGDRGVSSDESAGLGGMAHLVSFYGTDTLPALMAVHRYYGSRLKKVDVKGFSIPASEHSTITSWGQKNEMKAYRNLLDKFCHEGKIVACVSDSYDLENAVKNIFGKELKEQIVNSGGTLVIRPDSGDPKTQVMNTLGWLDESFGSVVNTKGYKVLNHVRVIQGDGVNPESIQEILDAMMEAKYSVDNIAFGMGGALLQRLDRDTQKFAMKTCAIEINGEWMPVFKRPTTDMGKSSKTFGRLTLVRHKESGAYDTKSLDDVGKDGWIDVMETIYEDGVLLKDYTFDQIRERAMEGFYNSEA